MTRVFCDPRYFSRSSAFLCNPVSGLICINPPSSNSAHWIASYFSWSSLTAYSQSIVECEVEVQNGGEGRRWRWDQVVSGQKEIMWWSNTVCVRNVVDQHVLLSPHVSSPTAKAEKFRITLPRCTWASATKKEAVREGQPHICCPCCPSWKVIAVESSLNDLKRHWCFWHPLVLQHGSQSYS